MKEFHEHIDKFIYINLDHRLDRKSEMEDHFNNYGIPSNKIIRLSATKHTKGNIGVYNSHIRTLQYAIDNNLQNILICEDDLEFDCSLNELNNIFDEFSHLFNDKYDIFQFAWGPSKMVKQIKKTNFYKCICGGCAVAYLVNNKFL